MKNRLSDWWNYDMQVIRHINAYTIPQYGNPSGDEQIDNFTPEDCWQNIQRYYNRRNSNARGNKERLRDLLKIAHYTQFIYDKLKDELNEDDVYPPLYEREDSDNEL